ncbi:hypothetical protein JZ751_021657, partial [Albula glossodonta]
MKREEFRLVVEVAEPTRITALQMPEGMEGSENYRERLSKISQQEMDFFLDEMERLRA